MKLIDVDALEDQLGVSDRDIYFKDVLADAPTIDAIPVVHCKDCRFLGIKGLGNGYCRKKMTGNINPYDFCSYGERRGEPHE